MLDKKTKIVCTIGPSSWDQSVMTGMIEAGMNCARVNGAFANPDELDKVKSLVKNAANDVSLMVDVKGPEVRMNKFSAPKPIKAGDEIIVGNTESDEIYPSNYKDLYKSLTPGQRVVIGDGDVELVIKKIEGDKMYCEVVYGELLKPGKALNLPGASITTEILTEKDKENLKHAIDTGWDFVSASFIQTADAARYVKKFIADNGGENKMKLIAKIEDGQGIDNIDEILDIVDGVMVARGGLGVELGLEKVPMSQRILIEKSNAKGKPVITATQMLESMIENPRPTRAEVNDVANAILAGTDSVMLSAESSAGKYPIEAVKYLTKIANEIEPYIKSQINSSKLQTSVSADAITKAAAQLCMESEGDITKVIVVSQSGTTARLLGRHSIKQPIYAYVSNDYYLRTVMLSKGIIKAFVQDKFDSDRDSAIELIIKNSLDNGIITKGEKVLIICKTPTSGSEYFPNIFEVITA
jgi:pyruvate kinase